MKKRLLLPLLIIILLPGSADAQFDRASLGARPMAMGGAFVSLGDDASALFVNPSAIVTASSLTFYGEYGDASGGARPGEAKFDILFPTRILDIGGGWYHRGADAGTTEDLFVLGIARNLVERAQGSFFSIGASLRLGQLSYEPTCACPGAGDSELKATADIGLVLRPLSVVSFGYAIENVTEPRFTSCDRSWRRIHRWGFSYFWEERLILIYEQEHRFDKIIRHYGFSLRTAFPLELMAGLSQENVTGGVRWAGDRIRVTASFMDEDGKGIVTKAALEVIP